MDGTGEHYAKWNKPGGERQIPYDLTYKWNLINKSNKQENRTRDIEIKHKLTVTRGEVRGEKGEGFSGTCTKDTWTIPKGVGWRGGDGDGWGGGECWGENGDNCT